MVNGYPLDLRLKMTDSERNGVYRILNEISSFTNRINNRMGYVVFPKEQQKMKARIQQALEDINFFKDIGVKDNDR